VLISAKKPFSKNFKKEVEIMLLWILYSLLVLAGIFVFPELTLAVVLWNSGYAILGVVALFAIYVPGFKEKGVRIIIGLWYDFVNLFRKE